VTRKAGPNDSYLWAKMTGVLRDAGVPDPDILARKLVAEVRRTTSTMRTFAPGETIPYDVTRGTDVDGDLWERLGDEPNRRDMWRMPGFDPDEHESRAQGCQLTPYLLETYGPCTEASR
jgi:hypothetical protein